jgi:hypothetical protein
MRHADEGARSPRRELGCYGRKEARPSPVRVALS